MQKVEIVIETYQTAPDMRCTGSKIYTGKKAFFLLGGKTKRNKIYCTNTGKHFYSYIYINGKKYPLNHDLNFAVSNVYRLDNLVGWYIEL